MKLGPYKDSLESPLTESPYRVSLNAMRAVTIKVAKAKLNELVDAATSGEQVILMRGSTHVAAIVPISADDLELAPRLTDEQAARFWRMLGDEERKPGTIEVDSAIEAVARLSKQARPKALRTRRQKRR